MFRRLAIDYIVFYTNMNETMNGLQIKRYKRIHFNDNNKVERLHDAGSERNIERNVVND